MKPSGPKSLMRTISMSVLPLFSILKSSKIHSTTGSGDERIVGTIFFRWFRNLSHLHLFFCASDALDFLIYWFKRIKGMYNSGMHMTNKPLDERGVPVPPSRLR